MMPNKKRAYFLVLLITICFTQVGWFGWFKKKSEEVNIGYIEHSSALPFFIAYKRGYFKEEGVNVKFVLCSFRSFMESLLTGRVNLITATSFPALFGIEAESPGLLRFFGTGGEKKGGELVYGIIVPHGSLISSLPELKGKKVGSISPFTTVNLKLILKSVGLDPDNDVVIVPVAVDVAVPALTSGHLDALLLDQPALTVAIETSGAKLISGNPRAEYIIDPYWSGAAAVTDKYLKKDPCTILKIFKALDRAIQDIRDNEEGSKAVLAEYTPLGAELAKKTGMYFLAKTSEPVDLEKIHFLADTLFEYKIIDKKINAKEMYVSQEYLNRMCETTGKGEDR